MGWWRNYFRLVQALHS